MAFRLKTLMITGAAALLAACATATPYQAAEKSGAYGFDQQQIESNRFSVSFSGNSLTERETVETYMLYRAAELAVNNGYDYFTVADAATDADKRVIASPSPFSGFRDPYYRGFSPRYDFYHPRFGWRSAYRHRSGFNRARRGGFYSGFGGRFYDPFFDDFDYREVTRFKANAQVLMGRGPKPDDVKSFNAREVLTNLGPKVVYPAEKS